MRVAQKDRVAVFNNRECRTVFSTEPNFSLRKRKQILKVVEAKYLTLYFSYSAEYLADVIQSLLLDGNLPYHPPPAPARIMPPKHKQESDSAVAEPFSLNGTIARFFLKDQFSDLSAVSHGERYPLHRLVVCPQSEILAKACEYNAKHAQQFAQGQPATFRFDDDIDDQISVAILIHYFYYQDYSASEAQTNFDTDNPDANPPSELLVHVRVFGLAERYCVKGLMLVARKKFEHAADSNPNAEHLMEAVREVYGERFPIHNTSIKSAIVAIFWGNKGLLDRDDVGQMLRELDGLSTDLLLGFHKNKGPWY